MSSEKLDTSQFVQPGFWARNADFLTGKTPQNVCHTFFLWVYIFAIACFLVVAITAFGNTAYHIATRVYEVGILDALHRMASLVGYLMLGPTIVFVVFACLFAIINMFYIAITNNASLDDGETKPFFCKPYVDSEAYKNRENIVKERDFTKEFWYILREVSDTAWCLQITSIVLPFCLLIGVVMMIAGVDFVSVGTKRELIGSDKYTLVSLMFLMLSGSVWLVMNMAKNALSKKIPEGYDPNAEKEGRETQ